MQFLNMYCYQAVHTSIIYIVTDKTKCIYFSSTEEAFIQYFTREYRPKYLI